MGCNVNGLSTVTSSAEKIIINTLALWEYDLEKIREKEREISWERKGIRKFKFVREDERERKWEEKLYVYIGCCV